MPIEKSVGFQDEERLFQVFDATGEEDEPEAVGLRKDRLYDLAMKDNELLAEESVLGNDIGFAARGIGTVLTTIEWREG